MDGEHTTDGDVGGLPAVESGAVAEDSRLMEARVDDEVREPGYGAEEELGQQGEAHGSHRSHGGTQASLEPAVPPSGGQRPVPVALSEVPEAGPFSMREERSGSVERRSEEVSQVARSLAFMTNLVTTLVGRMDRVEQSQSRGGSTGTGKILMEGTCGILMDGTCGVLMEGTCGILMDGTCGIVMEGTCGILREGTCGILREDTGNG
ncbi:unnamed protein product [Symbiodinium sp. CCMP2456]|nr:unnamed protein product [Symbiodinium sp. CCMP2456]